MELGNCDTSMMKQLLQADLEHLSIDIQRSKEVLQHDTGCLLGLFEQIRQHFTHIEATATSFYLNCYLSPYIEQYAELTKSITYLAAHKIGALIVVQREDLLEELIQIGTPIGATLTHTLLESIFNPGTPLHDGAVIIRSNVIVSAGNILPLTRTAPIGKKMGTRHRAALGLSEQSDALVLVVSEESGRASFALDGKLYPITAGGLLN
ncbi:sporulation-specific diadenylate cyclase CdaS [Paenibacillus sp. 481]|uniref:sporulation-specific diadenylate cyclase CdaS n=1 Tax=Paenibacillus sp. 481 TaxID=2835869 RepID=UPI001E31E719|nr:sporulation-specific diadenylate cyclase CdaS [Paenibacillus sp. 481]UHA72213.1 sporulation-specific diadenylate cyclase CdaS [Paenibacillus sp. 481]